MSRASQLQGLRALIGQAVDQGATAIERVHLATARRPFAVLTQIPGVAEPARVVQRVHDGVVSGVYGTVRLVNRAVGEALDAALDAAGEAAGDAAGDAALDAQREQPVGAHEPDGGGDDAEPAGS